MAPHGHDTVTTGISNVFVVNTALTRSKHDTYIHVYMKSLLQHDKKDKLHIKNCLILTPQAELKVSTSVLLIPLTVVKQS